MNECKFSISISFHNQKTIQSYFDLCLAQFEQLCEQSFSETVGKSEIGDKYMHGYRLN